MPGDDVLSYPVLAIIDAITQLHELQNNQQAHGPMKKTRSTAVVARCVVAHGSFLFRPRENSMYQFPAHLYQMFKVVPFALVWAVDTFARLLETGMAGGGHGICPCRAHWTRVPPVHTWRKL